MAASGDLYANVLLKAFSKVINLTSDTLNLALVSASYTPTLTPAGDQFWTTPQAFELPATGGYPTGGITMTTCALAETSGTSWAVTRATSTPVAYGQVVRPASANGFLYKCVVAGTTSSGTPTYPTVVGTTVVDGTVTWSCIGTSILVFKSDPVVFSGSGSGVTFATAANAAVIYDATPGTAATDPLITLQTFSTAQSPVGVNFTVQPDPNLGWFSVPSF